MVRVRVNPSPNPNHLFATGEQGFHCFFVVISLLLLFVRRLVLTNNFLDG